MKQQPLALEGEGASPNPTHDPDCGGALPFRSRGRGAHPSAGHHQRSVGRPRQEPDPGCISLTLFPYTIAPTLRLDQRADARASKLVGAASYRLTMRPFQGLRNAAFKHQRLALPVAGVVHNGSPNHALHAVHGAIKQIDDLKLSRPHSSGVPSGEIRATGTTHGHIVMDHISCATLRAGEHIPPDVPPWPRSTP